MLQTGYPAKLETRLLIFFLYLVGYLQKKDRIYIRALFHAIQKVSRIPKRRKNKKGNKAKEYISLFSHIKNMNSWA